MVSLLVKHLEFALKLSIYLPAYSLWLATLEVLDELTSLDVVDPSVELLFVAFLVVDYVLSVSHPVDSLFRGFEDETGPVTSRVEHIGRFLVVEPETV